MGTIPAGVQPGDFFCTYCPNAVDKIVTVGEWLNGDRFARTRGRRFAHSGVVTAVSTLGSHTAITIVEAEPGGVRQCGWHYGAGCVVVWSTGVMRAPNPDWAADKARSLVGTPYGFLNYPAIGARRLHVPVPWLDAYVASEEQLICSEVTDLAERAGGLTIRPDLPPALITPQQIADVLMEAGAVPMAGA